MHLSWDGHGFGDMNTPGRRRRIGFAIAMMREEVFSSITIFYLGRS